VKELWKAIAAAGRHQQTEIRKVSQQDDPGVIDGRIAPCAEEKRNSTRNFGFSGRLKTNLSIFLNGPSLLAVSGQLSSEQHKPQTTVVAIL
jgi:hypothetical protein